MPTRPPTPQGPPPGGSEPAEHRRETGRIAALLFSTGAVACLPALLLLHDPAPSRFVDLLIIAALTTAMLCFLVPWDRIGAAWLHVPPALGTIEVTLLVWQLGPAGDAFALFYVFVVVFAAYAFRQRRLVAAHVASASLASAAPLVYGPDTRTALAVAVVCAATLTLAATVVTWLRERLEAHHHELLDVARRDPLTGVGNYRTLHERLAYELSRHERHQRRFTVMVLDLDRFKEVNERDGHLEGDRVLRAVGEVLTATVRAEDTVARQGGDEFSVLAPETDARQADALARRLLDGIGRIVVGDHELSAALGWAIYPDDGRTPDELLARADARQRQVKQGVDVTPANPVALRLLSDAGTGS